jgi:hypothetical protein
MKTGISDQICNRWCAERGGLQVHFVNVYSLGRSERSLIAQILPPRQNAIRKQMGMIPNFGGSDSGEFQQDVVEIVAVKASKSSTEPQLSIARLQIIQLKTVRNM